MELPALGAGSEGASGSRREKDPWRHRRNRQGHPGQLTKVEPDILDLYWLFSRLLLRSTLTHRRGIEDEASGRDAADSRRALVYQSAGQRPACFRAGAAQDRRDVPGPRDSMV